MAFSSSTTPTVAYFSCFNTFNEISSPLFKPPKLPLFWPWEKVPNISNILLLYLNK